MCQQGCPIHTSIPEVMQLFLDNKINEAGKTLFLNNPLSYICYKRNVEWCVFERI